MGKEKKYDVDGEPFVQRPLVLGQLLPLCKIIEGVEIKSFSVQGIISALGENLSKAIAVMLIPENVALRDRDYEADAEWISEHMSAEMALEVVADFLSFNPVSSILAKVKEITGSFQMGLAAIASAKQERDKAQPTPYDALYTTSPAAT